MALHGASAFGWRLAPRVEEASSSNPGGAARVRGNLLPCCVWCLWFMKSPGPGPAGEALEAKLNSEKQQKRGTGTQKQEARRLNRIAQQTRGLGLLALGVAHAVVAFAVVALAVVALAVGIAVLFVQGPLELEQRGFGRSARD